MRARLLWAVMTLAALLLVVVGCGGGSSSGTTGTVKLVLADAPLHLEDGTVVEAVNVTITRVELMTADESSRVVLFEGSESVNLLELANTPLAQLPQLSATPVPAGTYQQVRFIVDDASTVVVNGESKPLKVASGPQTGLKVPVNMTVAAGVAQVLLLDFDLTKLHQNNQFLLTPNAVRAVAMKNAGAVTGTATLAEGVQPAGEMPVMLTLHLPGVATPIVSTQVVLTTAAPTATFVFNGVPAGSYVVTATAPEGEGVFTVDSPEFTVAAGQTADLGAVAIGTPPAPEPEPEPEPQPEPQP